MPMLRDLEDNAPSSPSPSPKPSSGKTKLIATGIIVALLIGASIIGGLLVSGVIARKSAKSLPSKTESSTSFAEKQSSADEQRAPRMKLTNVSIRLGDHWGLSGYKGIRPSIKIGGNNYYPSGNTSFKNLPQSAWYHFGVFETPELLPGPLELSIEIQGHSPNYVWYLQPDEWFKQTLHYETTGQDTNNNRNYLRWKFDVVVV